MSTARPLVGRRILVIEDELFIAMELRHMVQELGGEVLGPVNNVVAAKQLLEQSEVDGVVMDVRLDNETSAPLAEELLDGGMAVVLTTGYTDDMLPESVRRAPRLSKPYTRSDFEQIATLHFVRARPL